MPRRNQTEPVRPRGPEAPPPRGRACPRGKRSPRQLSSLPPPRAARDRWPTVQYRGRQNGEQHKQSLHPSSPSPVIVSRAPPYCRNRDRPRRGAETRDTPLASPLPDPPEHISTSASPTSG